MQLVFLCGGTGTRMQLELTSVKKKCLVNLNGIPILGHLINFFNSFIDPNLATIFVVSKGDNSVIKYVNKLKINANFVEQEKPDGVVNAMLLAQKIMIANDGLFILADIVVKGEFIDEVRFDKKIPSLYILKNDYSCEIRKNFGVKIVEDKIVKVIEKPSCPKELYCGMGIYYFTKQVLSKLKKTPVNQKSKEVEITDGLLYCINEGVKFRPIYFNGFYSNINTMEDLKAAESKI
jgi:dTDP-glucose pyrophosphorylase